MLIERNDMFAICCDEDNCQSQTKLCENEMSAIKQAIINGYKAYFVTKFSSGRITMHRCQKCDLSKSL